jgi:hypothetical protein
MLILGLAQPHDDALYCRIKYCAAPDEFKVELGGVWIISAYNFLPII